MLVHLIVVSGNDLVRRLVSDFAHGLGCTVDAVTTTMGVGVRIGLPDIEHALLELLTHVALSATKAGIDVTEPLCEVRYHRGRASTQVRLALRLSEFGIDTAASTA